MTSSLQNNSNNRYNFLRESTKSSKMDPGNIRSIDRNPIDSSSMMQSFQEQYGGERTHAYPNFAGNTIGSLQNTEFQRPSKKPNNSLSPGTKSPTRAEKFIGSGTGSVTNQTTASGARR